MAGDWIPMRTDLAEDPAVIAIAAATGLDELAVVGRLHKLWSWANRQLTDGNAPSVTDSWVDRYLSAPGFAAAMLDAGWLRSRSGGVEFPNFERWNSQGAKRRVLTARRVASHKAGGNAKGNAQGNAASVTTALPKEEKRREEEKKNPPPNPPPGAGGDAGASDRQRFVPVDEPDPEPTPGGVVTPPRFEDVRAAWNALGGGLAAVEHVSPKLRTIFSSRCFSVLFCQRWRDGLAKVAASPRCHGATGWTATLKWFLTEGSLEELLNGEFDAATPGGPAAVPKTKTAAGIEEVLRDAAAKQEAARQEAAKRKAG